MLRINCPFCGERDHSEFTYGGDATVIYRRWMRRLKPGSKLSTYAAIRKVCIASAGSTAMAAASG